MHKKSISKCSIVLVLFLLFAFGAHSQNKDALRSDLTRINSSEQDDLLKIHQTENRKRVFLVKKEDPLIDKINPIKLTFGGLLYFYQTSLSKHFSADCLYEPSCSNFSKDAISHYGLIKGIFLTSDRLSRCNRIAQTSLHPLTINPETRHSSDGWSKYQFKSYNPSEHFH
ncbi:membrane protein insertion efficiency factor YidD [Marinilabilia sp.]|uniref:membrane protein insertion efficiency factor YidD n=1 Tax=Marinilabilia sp. TaxID=2021252 RepID=UPI0025BC7D38|nr:membrane protein insertion efficiency factor YidD [Marinilabilia sp.]